MILIQGKGVSKGVVQGPIYFFQRASAAVSNAVAGDLEEEKRRLEEAKEKSMEQLCLFPVIFLSRRSLFFRTQPPAALPHQSQAPSLPSVRKPDI